MGSRMNNYVFAAFPAAYAMQLYGIWIGVITFVAAIFVLVGIS